jgi:NhaA family Na+:H+ antiporter
LANQEEHERIFEVEQVAQDGTTPLRRWEHALGLPVALLILPLFVFVNAGIELSVENFSEVFSNPVAMGVLCGLVVGKPAGILLGVWLVERAGWSRRPEAMTNRMLIGIGLLAGIGFTMSTFIANLALETQDGTLDHVKLSIILASVIAAIAGVVALRGADQPSTGVNG